MHISMYRLAKLVTQSSYRSTSDSANASPAVLEELLTRGAAKRFQLGVVALLVMTAPGGDEGNGTVAIRET